MDKKTLKAVIVGLKHLHPRGYMPLLDNVEQIEVVAAAEADEQVRESFCSDFSVKPYADYREMIEKEKPDLAFIFLPHALCPDAAEACAAKGIHLIVEKPMAATAKGAERIVTAARNAGVKISTPYLWRYHSIALEMKRLFDSGVLGRAVSCEGRCNAGSAQRYINGGSEWMVQKELSGGGPMLNLGAHWIDLFSWLFENEVTEVFGRSVSISEAYDIEDVSLAFLTFASGAVAVLDISYIVPAAYPDGRDLYLSVIGTKGITSWSPSFGGIHESLLVVSDAPEFAGAPRRKLEFELESDPGYCGVDGVRYLRDMAACILEDTPEPIPGEAGVNVMKVAEAVYRSAESGKMEKVRR